MRRLIFLVSMSILPSCQTLPEFYKAVDDIATDNAVTIICDRDCFKKNTDLKINIELIHKE